MKREEERAKHEALVQRANMLDAKWLAQDRRAVQQLFRSKRMYCMLQEEQELGASSTDPPLSRLQYPTDTAFLLCFYAFWQGVQRTRRACARTRCPSSCAALWSPRISPSRRSGPVRSSAHSSQWSRTTDPTYWRGETWPREYMWRRVRHCSHIGGHYVTSARLLVWPPPVTVCVSHLIVWHTSSHLK